MTKSDEGAGRQETAPICAWCGRMLPKSVGPGRPKKYCKRSHRQRHFEARKLASTTGLKPGEVLLSAAQLSEWRDAAYRLAAAIEDVDQDLAESATLRDYTEALLHLHGAATEVTRLQIEPLAVGD